MAEKNNITFFPLFDDLNTVAQGHQEDSPYQLLPPADQPPEGPPPDFDPYNMSHVPYPIPLKTLPTWEMGIKIACYVVIIVIALFGNLLVVTTVFSNLRMRTTTNFYIVNLALSDLLVTLSCMWVHLVDDLTEGWVLGAFFCRFNSFAQVLSLVASILTLTLISCDRFFGIVFALKARLTQRRWKTFVFLVWIIAVSISAPLLFYRKQVTRLWKDHVEIWCEDDWPSVLHVESTSPPVRLFPARTTYYTVISLVIYFIPIVIMSVAYSVIIWKLWSTQPPGEMIDRENATQMAIKKKVILMLLVILSVFAMCWFPFQVSILYNEYRPEQHKGLPPWYEKFTYFSTFLAYSNSAFNPIIYTCFNNSFRRGFRETFRRSFRRRRSRGANTFSTYYNTMEVKMDTMVKDSRHNLMTITDKHSVTITSSNGVRL